MSRLYVKVANTPESLAQGLMFVKHMPRDHGMLFVFSRQQILRFWGENTYLPLDIAFADANGVIRKISKISPLSRKTVACESPCKYAIEANDGFFSENKIEIGDKLIFENDDGRQIVSFSRKRRNSHRTSGSARARQILAQLMGDEVAYGLQPPQDAAVEGPVAQEPSLPTLSKQDLGAYLEDDLDEGQEPIDVAPPEEEQPVPQEPQEVPEPEYEYPAFNNAFDAAEWAMQNNEVMRINYTTKKGTAIVRDVEPHGSFHSDSTGHEILVTFDDTIGDIRAFIMKNIRSFAFTGERFEPKFKVV